MKVIIELLAEKQDGKWVGWCVTIGDKYADGLGYDEMLCLVAAITMPEKRPALHWLKTKEAHEAAAVSLKSVIKESE
jgi:hypothetical protein